MEADPRTLPAHSLTTWTPSGWGCHHSPHLAASSAWGRLSMPSTWSAAGSSRTARTAWTRSCATTGSEWAEWDHLGDRVVWGRVLEWDSDHSSSQKTCTGAHPSGEDLDINP